MFFINQNHYPDWYWRTTKFTESYLSTILKPTIKKKVNVEIPTLFFIFVNHSTEFFLSSIHVEFPKSIHALLFPW